MKYDNIKTSVIVLVMLCTIVIDVIWKHNVENSARIMAKYNTENIKNCVNELTLGKGQNNYRVVDDAELESSMRICSARSLTTPTGDVFAFDLRTLDFVFDPSLDCFVEGGKQLTVGSECSLHNDPQQCKQALVALTSGYGSDQYTKAWWKFNASKEYLEWSVAPSETIGFDGTYRGGITKPHQLVIVQGTVEDELIARYLGFRVVLYAIGFLAIIFTLLKAVHDNIKPSGCRGTDDAE